MPPKQLTPLQQGIISGASSLVSAGGNIVSTLLANKANRELAKYSFDQQRQMIREQNEYNSPLQQMARYKEAGLNPNLMFGNIENGNQSQLAKYEAPTMQAPNVDADVTSAMQLMLTAKRTEAEIDNINAQTQRYQEETRSAMLRNNWESFISGKPVDGWSFDGSRKLRQYDLGLQSQDVSNALNRVRIEVGKLDQQEKAFFVGKILPLTFQLKRLELQGASYENAMKAIDLSLWREKRIADMSANPFKAASVLIDGLMNPKSPVSKAAKDAITPQSIGRWLSEKKFGKRLYDWLNDWAYRHRER